MSFQNVNLIIDCGVRSLCQRPYPGHPKGCPNYGKKTGCPPGSELITELIDLDQPIFAIWNVFDFTEHIKKMRLKHPAWSERQLSCCLYWQRGARKELKKEIQYFMATRLGWIILRNPESNGVNVTATMFQIGERLEWPPKTKAYQVAIAGFPRNRNE